MLADEFAAQSPDFARAISACQRFVFPKEATDRIIDLPVPRGPEWGNYMRAPFDRCWFEFQLTRQKAAAFVRGWPQFIEIQWVSENGNLADPFKIAWTVDGFAASKAFGGFTQEALLAGGSLIGRALIALNTKNLFDMEETEPTGNRRRIARGRRPLFSHHLCKLQTPRAGGGENAGAGVRAHLVRGHIKIRKTGPFWWAPFARGNAALGIVTKDYAA